eukprot:TRINITY_DN30309_c0_g1_i1.p1 TRINITY_DN30309_c0_g1~~TRINITY_DN30309_c0_g1_i1.p1  ORF type:complete len:1006 (+),score=127.16 TRINITY_DN30309_c0_g1_i1:130-3147(+)
MAAKGQVVPAKGSPSTSQGAIGRQEAKAAKGVLAKQSTSIGQVAPAVIGKSSSSSAPAVVHKRGNTGASGGLSSYVQIGVVSTEDVEIHPGHFSWLSAFFMCLSVIACFSSLIPLVLSWRDTAGYMISREVSHINAASPPWPLPPWGQVRQPNGAESRKIGEEFDFAVPQSALYFSMFASSFGLFTVSYFCSELLVQDMGSSRVKLMGDLINTGVRVYLQRTLPVILVVMLVISFVIFFFAGLKFVICVLVGGLMSLLCSYLGTDMNFTGGPRLTHALNHDLPSSLLMGVRVGAIGGISAHATATLGIAGVWMMVRESRPLVGFGAGVSIVAFYNRIGGGIFAKGSDIGSDFVSTMLGEGDEEMIAERVRAEYSSATRNDDDSDEEDEPLFKDDQKAADIDPNTYMDESFPTFPGDSKEEAEMRARIEAEMEKNLSMMHPINYLDAIGENIADVGGTSTDLFESMCMTLATSVNFGAKAHEVPFLGTGLPFVIISSGTLLCSIATYWVWCHEKHSSSRIRNALRLNLVFVIVGVQTVVCIFCYMNWKVWHMISFERMLNYDIIVLVGLLSPEICAYICEFFTSINCPPVRWIATNAHLGMIQVILQGLGQGFLSIGLPAAINIGVQVAAYQWEGFYGLSLLACASQACTGWQATLSAYGAVGNNANRMVTLTTVNEMAQRRANSLAAIGTTTSHNGKCVGGQVAFFSTTSLLTTLMAEKYTLLGKNFKMTVGQELSQWTRAGLLAGIICAFLFLANTLTGCIMMTGRLVTYCKGNASVSPRQDKVFPATHIGPLKTLVGYASIEACQLTLAPMLQTAAAPLVIGQLFGFKGLLMAISGGNSVCFCMNLFLINSGQAWDAARKYVVFGMLRDETGKRIGHESDVYETLGIGEQIGGPLEDVSGPAMNNFIKCASVTSFITSGLYDEEPYNTWIQGLLQVFINFSIVSFFKFGLQWTISAIDDIIKRRQQAIEYEEGVLLLREIEAKEIAAQEALAMEQDDDEFPAS